LLLASRAIAEPVHGLGGKLGARESKVLKVEPVTGRHADDGKASMRPNEGRELMQHSSDLKPASLAQAQRRQGGQVSLLSLF